MTAFKDSIERLVRTLVQVVAAAVLVYVQEKGWDDIDWSIVWKTAVTAGLICILTALAGSRSGSATNDTSFQ